MSNDDLKQFMEMVTGWGPSIRKIDSIDARITSIESKVDAVSTQMAQMETRITGLEQASGNTSEGVKVLRDELYALKAEVNKLEQHKLENEFLLHGLPPSVTSQDILTVLDSLGTKVDTPITVEDFREPPRIFTNRNRSSSTIIGTFISHEKKNKVMKGFKAKRPIFCEDLVDLPATSTYRGKMVTIRNSLTSTNRRILSEALRLKGDLFRFAWEVYGRVLLRRDENSRTIEISSVDQLHNVIEDARNGRV